MKPSAKRIHTGIRVKSNQKRVGARMLYTFTSDWPIGTAPILAFDGMVVAYHHCVVHGQERWDC